MNQTHFSHNEQEVLKFLYEDLGICDWALITAKINEQFDLQRTMEQCKKNYITAYDPEPMKAWTQSEERQLYKLHDQYGNKWASIANHFIGRTDNCVKNHLYSKLRKSLRTLNKIARVCFKKELKEINNSVLYKLTEATEEKFKKQPLVEQNLIEIGQKLKTGLLMYELEDRDIQKGNDYGRQKQFIKELLAFNKDYKKKTKKDKAQASSYSQNIKKALQKKRQLHQKAERKQTIAEESLKNSTNLTPLFVEEVSQDKSNYNEEKKVKKLVNFLIKAPTVQEQNQFMNVPQKKKSNGIEDILKASGILQNGQDQVPNLFKRQNSQKALSSRRSSFSNVSDSSYTDMFGEEFGCNFKEYSEMEGDSEFFQKNQP